MPLSFKITNPKQFLEKLHMELQDFEMDCKSSRPAINFCLTAYHLREWIWKFYFENKPHEIKRIFDTEINEETFNEKIYLLIPYFKLIRDIANGTKHFSIDKRSLVKKTSYDDLTGIMMNLFGARMKPTGIMMGVSYS